MWNISLFNIVQLLQNCIWVQYLSYCSWSISSVLLVMAGYPCWWCPQSPELFGHSARRPRGVDWTAASSGRCVPSAAFSCGGMETTSRTECPPGTTRSTRPSARQTDGSCSRTQSKPWPQSRGQITRTIQTTDHGDNGENMGQTMRAGHAAVFAHPPGHLDLSGAPLVLQVVLADHTDGLPASVDGVGDVLDDGLPCGDNSSDTEFHLQTHRSVRPCCWFVGSTGWIIKDVQNYVL